VTLKLPTNDQDGEFHVMHDFQSRTGLNKDRVAQIADAKRNKAKVPPVRVFEIDDPVHKMHGQKVLVGGFHRVAADVTVGNKTTEATVETGTWGDALRAAALENIEHDTAGLPRTNADKNRAVMVYAHSYKDVVQPKRPAYREMAKVLGVSHQHLNNMDPFGKGKDVPEAERGVIKDRSVDGNGKKKPKQLKKFEVFDFVEAERYAGWSVRAVDAICSARGIDPRSKGPKEALDGLSAYIDFMSQMKKEITADPKKKDIKMKPVAETVEIAKKLGAKKDKPAAPKVKAANKAKKKALKTKAEPAPVAVIGPADESHEYPLV
jgi:hypothetical protein